jgi:hypothetical protein
MRLELRHTVELAEFTLQFTCTSNEGSRVDLDDHTVIGVGT